MRQIFLLCGLSLLASADASSAQIATGCALFKAPTGEVVTLDHMRALQEELLTEARRGRTADLSFGGTPKEVAAREARQKKAEQEAADRRAKIQNTLATYKCVKDANGNTPERG